MTNEEIDSLLITAGSSAQGACLDTSVSAAQLKVLRDSGLVGASNGLTRKGSIRAERARSAALDAVFGPL